MNKNKIIYYIHNLKNKDIKTLTNLSLYVSIEIPIPLQCKPLNICKGRRKLFYLFEILFMTYISYL